MVSVVNITALAILLVLTGASIVSPVHKTDATHSSNHLHLVDLSAKMELSDEAMTQLTTDSSEPGTPAARGPVFVFRNSTVGFTRISAFGVAVTRGASASLSFSFPIEALRADVLQANTSLFRRRLTAEENIPYGELVRNYEGGLNMPFMETIGANLDMNVSRDDLTESFSSQENYNRKALAAREILTADPMKRVTLSGSIMVAGNSIIPRTFFAFIKVSQVHLNDGTTVVVVSTDPKDIEAATSDGFTTEGTSEVLTAPSEDE